MKITTNGRFIAITYEPWNFDRLYSPDGKLHLLPCDCCERPEWVEPNVDVVICTACAESRREEQ